MYLKNEGKVPVANRLLATLPRAEYQQILPHLEPTFLTFCQLLPEPGSTIKYVYFPCESLFSLFTVVDKTHALEIAIIGPEGMIGVGVALGAGNSTERVIVEREGRAMRMRVASFLQQTKKAITFQREVLLYKHLLMAQLAHTAACNRFLPIEARLAYRLLVTRDRLGTNHFSLTHETLGQMLGVRRVGITTAAHALKARHLIDYSRGNISLLDVRGLEVIVGSCYALAKDIHHES